jgi:hypothetical protein
MNAAVMLMRQAISFGKPKFLTVAYSQEHVNMMKKSKEKAKEKGEHQT